jgi:hypothetical protein
VGGSVETKRVNHDQREDRSRYLTDNKFVSARSSAGGAARSGSSPIDFADVRQLPAAAPLPSRDPGKRWLHDFGGL